MEKAGIQRNNGSSFYAQNGEILQLIEIECGTQRQGDKRSAAADLIASNAPLRARRKSPWGKHVGTKHVRFTVNINSRGFKGAANSGPAKAQRSGFGGERRSNGMTDLCPERQNEGYGVCDDEARLSPLSFVVQRKMESPKSVG